MKKLGKNFMTRKPGLEKFFEKKAKILEKSEKILEKNFLKNLKIFKRKKSEKKFF